MSSIQPINIRPNQLEHFQRVLNILTKFYFYIDGSETGTGKTYIAAAVAITLKLPCIIFCPKSARETWRRVFMQHGVLTYQITKHHGIITYESLRSVKRNQPKHGLLIRTDMSTHPTFYPTELLTALITNGVFIIFDEAQKLKNDSDQHHAAAALMRHFYTLGTNSMSTVTTTPASNIRSRFALLSASLVDKPEHVINLMEMVGFIQSARKSGISAFGIQDVINKASQINPREASRFLMSTQMGTSAEASVQYVYYLFINVIRPIIMSTIPRAITNAIKDVKNGYYSLTTQEQIVYNQAINRLAENLAMRLKRKELHQALKLIRDPDDPTVAIIQNNLEQTRQNNPGDITNALIALQEAKMSAMIRVTRQLLSLQFTYNGKIITPKIVLFADYYRVIDYLKQNLSEFNPVELTGRISETQRTANINAFQEANDKIRLVIGNPLVGGIAINLHDVTGLFPRIMFVMPNFRANELQQATGRTFRDGTIGVAIIRFFYGRANVKEKSILDVLARKGGTLKDIHIEQSQYGVKFPNEYPDEDETEFMANFMNLFIASSQNQQAQITNSTIKTGLSALGELGQPSSQVYPQASSQAPSQSPSQAPSQVYSQAPSQVYSQAPSQVYSQAPSQVYSQAPSQVYSPILSNTGIGLSALGNFLK
jgi:hypothetical protein